IRQPGKRALEAILSPGGRHVGANPERHEAYRMIQQLGKYRILERIGRGGMGTVYKAHDPILNRNVALKIVSAQTDITDELRQRFFQEAQVTAGLSHPNVLSVYDLGDEQGQLFIVMEFLDGAELTQLIAGGRLTLAEKLSIMVQVCDGLAYAHDRGIVHRDIKPGNIFILRAGTVKILDFGLARMVEASAMGLTQTGVILGTLRYMAPEQARGHTDLRSDIFSAGAVFYELLVSRTPFVGEYPMSILEALRSQKVVPLRTYDPTIPIELDQVVERALEKDPARRFQTFHEMRRELEVIRRRVSGISEVMPEDQARATPATTP